MKSSVSERALNKVYHKGHVFVMIKKAACFMDRRKSFFQS